MLYDVLIDIDCVKFVVKGVFYFCDRRWGGINCFFVEETSQSNYEGTFMGHFLKTCFSRRFPYGYLVTTSPRSLRAN